MHTARELASKVRDQNIVTYECSELIGKLKGKNLTLKYSSRTGHPNDPLPLIPSKEKTGLIAYVDVNKSAKGKGVEFALILPICSRYFQLPIAAYKRVSV